MTYEERLAQAKRDNADLIGLLLTKLARIHINMLSRDPLQDDEDDQIQEVNHWLRRADSMLHTAYQHAKVGQ